MHLHIYKHYLLSRNPLHCRFVMSDSFSVASGYWAQAYFMAFWCPGGGELLPTEHHWCSVDVEGSGVNDGLPLVNHDWSWLIIVTDTWQFWLMVMVPILHGYGLLPIIILMIPIKPTSRQLLLCAPRAHTAIPSSIGICCSTRSKKVFKRLVHKSADHRNEGGWCD